MSEPVRELGAAEPFFAAIADGDLAAVRAAIDARPELLAAVSDVGVRPPLAALYAGHPSLADELAGRSGALDIHEAAAFDDTARLRELLLLSPDAAEQYSPDGWTPLHLAAYFGRTESVRLLLDDDAPVDALSRNDAALTALHAASAGRHSESVWLLIASGADVTATQRGGWTALHAAAANGDVDSVQALLSAGAPTDALTDDGRSVQELAADGVPELLARAAG